MDFSEKTPFPKTPFSKPDSGIKSVQQKWGFSLTPKELKIAQKEGFCVVCTRKLWCNKSAFAQFCALLLFEKWRKPHSASVAGIVRHKIRKQWISTIVSKDLRMSPRRTQNPQSSCPAEVRKRKFSPLFSAKGVVKFGVKFWWNFPRYVFQGLGVRRKISPKFHVKKGVKNGKFHANFTLLGCSAENPSARAGGIAKKAGSKMG